MYGMFYICAEGKNSSVHYPSPQHTHNLKHMYRKPENTPTPPPKKKFGHVYRRPENRHALPGDYHLIVLVPDTVRRLSRM